MSYATIAAQRAKAIRECNELMPFYRDKYASMQDRKWYVECVQLTAPEPEWDTETVGMYVAFMGIVIFILFVIYFKQQWKHL